MEFMTSENTTDVPGNSTIDSNHVCKRVLYAEVMKTRVWDWMILLPNIVFMTFLILRFKSSRVRLSTNQSPVLVTFYALVIICVVMSILRCIISMSVSSLSGETLDKVFWVIVRFFFLSMEISVLVFGLAFGHLDTETSIRRVLLVTTLTSLTYSILQGSLEIIAPDEKFNFHDDQMSPTEFKLYSHGGMTFWAVTCFLFCLVYASVTLLPLTSIRRRIPLPAKKSFYVYTAILATVNLFQGLGSLLFKEDFDSGLCLIDLTTFLYFSFFHVLVYWTFLSSFFSLNPTSLLFPYKHQMDDLVVEDQLEGPSGVNAESNIGVAGQRNGRYLEFSGETSVLSFKTEDLSVTDMLTIHFEANSDGTTVNSSAFASPTEGHAKEGKLVSFCNRGADDTDDDDETLVSSIMSDSVVSSDSYATAREGLSTADASLASSRNQSLNRLV